MEFLNHKIYESSPEAEWVIFVHGVVGSISTFDSQVSFFKEQKMFNILLIDLRDHGDSINMPLPEDGITIDLLSQDIVDLMDHLKIRNAHFVAVSISTVFVRLIEEKHPGYVKSIVLSGGVFRLTFKFYAMINAGIYVSRLVPLKKIYRLLAVFIFPKKYQRKYRIIFLQAASKLNQAAFSRRLAIYKSLRARLVELNNKPIQSPCLIIMGSNDAVYLPFAINYRKRFDQPRLEIIPDCGHICNIESPDAFNSKWFHFIRAYTTSK